MNIFIVVWVLTPVLLIIAVVLIQLWSYYLLRKMRRTIARMDGDIIGLREGMKHNYDKINDLERGDE